MAGAGKKNADYWKRRFEAMEDAGYQKSREYYERIQKAFDRAERSIRADLERWYTRLAKNNHISLAEAKKLLGRDELAEFKWTVEDYIKAGEENALNQNWMKELENASARHHINYLNAMKIQIRQHAEELYARYESSLAKHLSDTFQDTYYHTAYEIETGLEVGSSLAQPDTRKIDTFINRPWAADGANFSDRIWTDKKKLVNSLNTELTQSIIRGEDPEKAIKSLSKTMGVSKNNAGRLIMTESAAVSSAAQKECFKELDVEQYQIVATLDSITSELCRSLDGKIFRMSEYETGVTAPPFHPWCRTTTVPYFEDNDSVRAARGKDGKTYYVDGNLTYKEWEEKYVKGKNEEKPNKHTETEELTLDEKGAVIRYISPDSYVLNDKLRRNAYSELTDFEKEWMNHLDNAINKLPRYKGSLNRSMTFLFDEDAKAFFDSLKEGEEYVTNQYLSTTKKKLYNEIGQVQMYIHDSNQGRDLKGLNDMEQEVLYPRRTRFRVVQKLVQNNYFKIFLEDVT